MNNEKFIYDGASWNSSRKMYWNEGQHNVYAYYPYVKNVNDVEDFTFTVALDQNAPASAGGGGDFRSLISDGRQDLSKAGIYAHNCYRALKES